MCDVAMAPIRLIALNGFGLGESAGRLAHASHKDRDSTVWDGRFRALFYWLFPRHEEAPP